MLDHLQRGDLKSARHLYEGVIQPLVSTIFAPPVRDYRVRTKEALAELGVIDSADVRAPLLPLQDAERQSVRAAIRNARLRTPQPQA